MNSVRNNIPRSAINILSASKTLGKFDSFYISKQNQSRATGFLKYVVANTVLNSFKAYCNFKKNLDGKKPVQQVFPKDTVILYQFPRARYTPSLSPFCLKLETWCRAANVKYQNKLGLELSKRGTVPFIRLNDYVVEDSEKCIEYLSKVYQVDLNSGLNEEQKAVARATLALVEDSLKWSVILHRFWYSNMKKQESGLPLLTIWLFSYKMFRAGWFSGYGRYSKQEIYERGKRDLNALDNLIGNKKFLFSDEKPCNVDISIFSMCAQIKYNDRGPLNQHLLNECHNVNRHIETIKSMYWSDWDQNIMATRIPKKKPLVQKVLSLFRK
ncbi:unnamed protein product [Brachionus calyciflorus]|uniref:Uncharacterized protein n=1 Tax=Brachionus calyciflorus TaxID=104777 RepID=A0A813U0P9_9BILA|nr:unnamed protein product [Brachionus calyciflorus]